MGDQFSPAISTVVQMDLEQPVIVPVESVKRIGTHQGVQLRHLAQGQPKIDAGR